jgi:hypothetical protein
VSVPINNALIAPGTQITTLTIEFWFKADDVASMQL